MADDDVTFPDTGTGVDDLLAEIHDARAGDADWRSGRTFSLIYNVGDPELERLLHAVADEYLHENALQPVQVPEPAAHGAGDHRHGLRSARRHRGRQHQLGRHREHLPRRADRPRPRPGRAGRSTAPNIVTGTTAHPAFAKACKYLGIEQVRVDVGPDLRVHVGSMADAIDDDTVLVVGSAPCYPYGVIDDIPGIAGLAESRGVLCHVDACLGGWLLPFWERLGEPVPPWNLSRPRRDVDLGRRPQVRLHLQGPVDGAVPRPRPAQAPALPLRRLARRPVRVGHHRRHPTGRARSPGRGAPSATWGCPATSRLAERVRDATRRLPRRASTPSTASGSPARPRCRSSSSAPTRST